MPRPYDPAYTRSTLKHYPRYGEGLILQPQSLSMEAMQEAAREILGR